MGTSTAAPTARAWPGPKGSPTGPRHIRQTLGARGSGSPGCWGTRIDTWVRNPQSLELRFRALLTEGDARVLSIARRPTSLVRLDREVGNLGAKRARYLVEFASFPTWAVLALDPPARRSAQDERRCPEERRCQEPSWTVFPAPPGIHQATRNRRSRPSRRRRTFSRATSKLRVSVSWVSHARCGVSTTLSSDRSGWSGGGGSSASTSRPAANSRPLVRASTSA